MSASSEDVKKEIDWIQYGSLQGFYLSEKNWSINVWRQDVSASQAHVIMAAVILLTVFQT